MVEIMKSLIVVDNFYSDPFSVRERAIRSSQFKVNSEKAGFNGFISAIPISSRRTLMSKIAKIVNTGIVYQLSLQGAYKGLTGQQYKSKTTFVHYDLCDWSGVLCLTPDNLIKGHTCFWRHRKFGDGVYDPDKVTAICNRLGCTVEDLFAAADRDSKKMKHWTLISSIEHRFNRLILFRGNMFHSSSEGFGNNIKNCKLTQTFFFDESPRRPKSLQPGWEYVQP